MTSDAIKLAHVEIAGALGALHRRFCEATRFPPPPGPGRAYYGGNKVVHSAERRNAARTAVYKWQVGRIEKARERSLQMSACDEVAEVGRACIRYRDWLDHLIGGHSNDAEYDAAHSCIKDARELVSIVAIASSYPESAAKRARAIALGKKRRSTFVPIEEFA